MEKIDYGFYDSIDNTATRWLAWNLNEHKKIGFKYIDGSRFEELWLLCMARNLNIYSEEVVYIKTSLLNYLWLRFFKKFKFLRRYHAREHQDVFLIDGIAFIEEVAEACNATVDIIANIYEIYYKR